MATLFMLAAVVGGTVLLFQFALTMFGFMHIGGDFGDSLSLDDASGSDSLDHVASGTAAWLLSFISFRSLTAAATFFGLFGLAMRSSGASPSLQLSSAIIAGLAAMYTVHGMMRMIQKLAQDNTMQVKRAIGKVGTVYLQVPGENRGTGKVHVTVQGRLEEFEATTLSRDILPVGAKVVVIGVAPSETLVVEAVEREAEPAAALSQQS